MAIPKKHEDDWSDSDEEDERSDVETSVLLGIPDGEIEKQEDLDDAAVSRIGGHPAFLTTTEPSNTSSQCKHCSFPMELLVQLWCPFEDSPMDRALYAFGCSRGECQHKPGSIRAFRGLRYNATYAAKLEKKRAREREREAARLKAKEEEEKKKSAIVNPFSMNSSAAPPGGLFGVASASGNGLGTQLFGPSKSHSSKMDPTPEKDNDEEASPPPESDSESEPEDADAESASESSEKSFLAVPAHTPSSSSPWLAAPAYTPPFYLSTAQEYVPPAPKPLKLSSSVQEGDEGDEDEKGRGKSKKAELRRAEKEKEDEKDRKAWENAMEGYEDSLEVDKVFEKFARVAGYEGEQCIRYELGGTPLPYSNDMIFKSLFPSPSASSSTTTMTSVSSSTKFTPSPVTPARRMYDPKSTLITPCPRCGGPRTFECQLMPHLISILHSTRTQPQKQQTSASKSASEQDPEARKRELEPLLPSGQGRGDGGSGMEWGTCMVFSCSQDCCLDPVSKEEAKELWAEELVLVQWDE
ncbi:hypothetical protein ACEPAH_3508 [Sanghuangporus vaninii]